MTRMPRGVRLTNRAGDDGVVPGDVAPTCMTVGQGCGGRGGGEKPLINEADEPVVLEEEEVAAPEPGRSGPGLVARAPSVHDMDPADRRSCRKQVLIDQSRDGATQHHELPAVLRTVCALVDVIVVDPHLCLTNLRRRSCRLL